MLDQAKQTYFTTIRVRLGGEYALPFVGFRTEHCDSLDWWFLWRCIRTWLTSYTFSDSNWLNFLIVCIGHVVTLWAPADSNLYGFKICNVPRILGASPSTLKSMARRNPKDFMKHPRSAFITKDIFWTIRGGYLTWIIYKINLKAYCAANDGTLVTSLVWWMKRGGHKSLSWTLRENFAGGSCGGFNADSKVDVGELWCFAEPTIDHTNGSLITGICLGSEQPRCCHSWWKMVFRQKHFRKINRLSFMFYK